MLPHGSNLTQKERADAKYADEETRRYLAEIRAAYDQWASDNASLLGPTNIPDPGDQAIVSARVALLEQYKDFVDQQEYAENFDSRSNLHSTVLEEFLYYLFRDLVTAFGKAAHFGKSHSFKDVFFVPPSYTAMTQRPHATIERKDHDFIIGITVDAKLAIADQGGDDLKPAAETHQFDVPAVAIECKTYLDKTMLEGASRAAEELKARSPNSLYLVVMEWLKLTEAVNLRKYKVDQIYVFRRQRNTDREYRYAEDYEKNPIDPSVVWHLYSLVRNHLTADWDSSIQRGLERGWLI